MEARQKVTNVAFSSLSAALSAMAGLITVPFLLKHFGADQYGVWTLITATTAYFLLLDGGVTASTGRLIAGTRARSDDMRRDAVVSTALVAFSISMVLVLLFTLGAIAVFFRVFNIPPILVGDARIALIITGVSVALHLQCSIFACLLWGYERFDLLGIVDMTVLVVRTCAIFAFIDTGSSLTLLALITLGGNVLGACLYGIMCLRLRLTVSARPRLVTRNVAQELIHYGMSLSVLNAGRTLTGSVGVFILGHMLTSSAVTTFSIARQLSFYSNAFMMAVTQVATARASYFHFADDVNELKALLITGGRYTASVALFFVVGLCVFGAPFLHLWQSGRQDEAYLPLIVLMLGEALPMSQWVTSSIAVSMGRQRDLGILAFAEGATAILLSVLMVKWLGVLGVAIAVSIAATVFRGALYIRLGCKLLDVSLDTYIMKALVPAALPAAATTLLISWLSREVPISSWFDLCAIAAVYAVVYALAAAPFVLGRAGGIMIAESLGLKRSDVE